MMHTIEGEHFNPVSHDLISHLSTNSNTLNFAHKTQHQPSCKLSHAEILEFHDPLPYLSDKSYITSHGFYGTCLFDLDHDLHPAIRSLHRSRLRCRFTRKSVAYIPRVHSRSLPCVLYHLRVLSPQGSTQEGDPDRTRGSTNL